MSEDDILFIKNSKTSLSKEVIISYQKLFQALQLLELEDFYKKNIIFNGPFISPAELLSYQIGWAELLLSWYHQGKVRAPFIMPGKGFDRWDYKGIAEHFFREGMLEEQAKQLERFTRVVMQIVEIIEEEHHLGNLEATGVWSWCTLRSGKQWPLSKWIRVNTIAPYKRALSILRKRKNENG